MTLSTLPVGTFVAVAIVLVVTGLVTIGTQHRTVRMVMVVPIYGIAVSGALITAAAYDRLQAQRDYDNCVSMVTRSDGNRDQHLTLYAVLDRELHDTRIGDELRTALDANLPNLTPTDCEAP